jgi:hypothetical protein
MKSTTRQLVRALIRSGTVPVSSSIALALVVLVSAACSTRASTASTASPAPPSELRDVLTRGVRLNWYVRAQSPDSEWIEGRLRTGVGRKFRIGDITVEPLEIELLLRRDDARGLRDWKPFAAAMGVGGLTGLFAGFLTKAMFSDDTYTGSESAKWFVGGTVVGVVGLLVFSGSSGETSWVQEWPQTRQ